MMERTLGRNLYFQISHRKWRLQLCLISTPFQLINDFPTGFLICPFVHFISHPLQRFMHIRKFFCHSSIPQISICNHKRLFFCSAVKTDSGMPVSTHKRFSPGISPPRRRMLHIKSISCYCDWFQHYFPPPFLLFFWYYDSKHIPLYLACSLKIQFKNQ